MELSLLLPFDSLKSSNDKATNLGLGIDFAYKEQYSQVKLHAFIVTTPSMTGSATLLVNGTETKVNVNGEYTSFGLALSRDYKLSENFGLYGKLGVLYSQNSSEYTTRATSQKILDRNIANNLLFIGIGVDYKINQKFAIALEYNSGYSAITDSRLVQLNLTYRF